MNLKFIAFDDDNGVTRYEYHGHEIVRVSEKEVTVNFHPYVQNETFQRNVRKYVGEALRRSKVDLKIDTLPGGKRLLMHDDGTGQPFNEDGVLTIPIVRGKK